MPTNQPSSAPQADAPQPMEELTAAAVLHDGQLDQPAGGGGLGGASAAAGAERAGAATPNSPIEAETPHDGGEGKAEDEVKVLSASTAPVEPGHASR